MFNSDLLVICKLDKICNFVFSPAVKCVVPLFILGCQPAIAQEDSPTNGFLQSSYSESNTALSAHRRSRAVVVDIQSTTEQIPGVSGKTNFVSLRPGASVIIEIVPAYGELDPSSMYIYEGVNHGYLTDIYGGAVSYTHYLDSGTEDRFNYMVADYNGYYLDPIEVHIRVDDAASNSTEYLYTTAAAPEWTTSSEEQYVADASEQIESAAAPSWWQPKASDNLKWQLQLQGDLKLVDGVTVYAVDYTASQESIDAAKATGAKVMCYISAGSAENWREDFNSFPEHVVGNAYENWPGEWWLDTRDIDALAPIMRARMLACRDKGFDAIDADNVNGFENSTGFYISRQESIDYIRWLADEAHSLGMAFSLKNSENLVEELRYTVDMIQSESCFVYDNCSNASLMSAVNKPVFAVEYAEAINEETFWQACAATEEYNFSMIYRDVRLFADGPYLSCN